MKRQGLSKNGGKSSYDSFCFKLAVTVLDRRKELRLSQVETSKLSRVSVGTIKSLEDGKSSPSLDNLMRVLYVLGLRLVLEVENGGYKFTCQDEDGVPTSPESE